VETSGNIDVGIFLEICKEDGVLRGNIILVLKVDREKLLERGDCT